MATITQADIDAIVRLQVQITPEYHIIHDTDETTALSMLDALSYCQPLTPPARLRFIIRDKQKIIGFDTLALLRQQYDVADCAQLIFNKLALGGALLKDARAVVFDHCDFTTCHALKNRTPAFIRTVDNNMNDFTRTRFLACDLHEVLFKNVTLNQAYFANAKLSATQFLYSDLASCDFESITFNRMPSFVHSNLYHSHAHLHPGNYRRASLWFDKTALVGGLLISASALLITLMMFKWVASTTAMGALAVGLLVSGVILAYLGTASSERQKNIAKKYQLFEATVSQNAQNDRAIEQERDARYGG